MTFRLLFLVKRNSLLESKFRHPINLSPAKSPSFGAHQKPIQIQMDAKPTVSPSAGRSRAVPPNHAQSPRSPHTPTRLSPISRVSSLTNPRKSPVLSQRHVVSSPPSRLAVPDKWPDTPRPHKPFIKRPLSPLPRLPQAYSSTLPRDFSATRSLPQKPQVPLFWLSHRVKGSPAPPPRSRPTSPSRRQYAAEEPPLLSAKSLAKDSRVCSPQSEPSRSFQIAPRSPIRKPQRPPGSPKNSPPTGFGKLHSRSP